MEDFSNQKTPNAKTAILKKWSITPEVLRFIKNSGSFYFLDVIFAFKSLPHLLFTEPVSQIDRMCHITHEFITAEFTITFFFAKKTLLLQRISDNQNYFICFVKAADRSKDVITSGFSTIWTAKWEIIPRLFQHFSKYSEFQAISTEKFAIDTTAVPICFSVYFSYTVICRYGRTPDRLYWKFNNFKLKQTLQLADFMGYNENAVRWQIWTGLLAYLLLRFIPWKKHWKHTFNRLYTLLVKY